MAEIRPLINHIAWIGPDGQWHSRGFLPLYSHALRWDTDVKCPRDCKFGPRCHPMVWDEYDRGHKLCTLTVIKAGLVKERELI